MEYKENNVPCQIIFDTGQWKSLRKRAVWPRSCLPPQIPARYCTTEAFALSSPSPTREAGEASAARWRPPRRSGKVLINIDLLYHEGPGPADALFYPEPRRVRGRGLEPAPPKP